MAGEVDPNHEGLGRATIGLGGFCTATLIAPEWVLTSAHCVGGRSTWTVRWTDDASGLLIQVDADACAIHPLALVGPVPAGEPTLTTCALAPASAASYPDTHDVALLHLERPITERPHRTIGAPRVCMTTTGVGTFWRGFGGGAVDGMNVASGTGTIETRGRASPTGPLVRFEITSSLARIIGGDSGGTLTVASSDERGPVIGVNSSREGDVPTGSRVGRATLVWGATHAAPRRRPAWTEVDARGMGLGAGPLGSDVVYASRHEVSFVAEPSSGVRVVSYRPDAARFRAGDCMTDVF